MSVEVTLVAKAETLAAAMEMLSALEDVAARYGELEHATWSREDAHGDGELDRCANGCQCTPAERAAQGLEPL